MYSCISMVATVAFQTLDNEKTALGGLFFSLKKTLTGVRECYGVETRNHTELLTNCYKLSQDFEI